MPVYNRTDSLAEEVVQIERAAEDLKSMQIVGNDNLVVRIYIDEIFSTVVTGGTTAVFKATFTFDEPSTAYVDRSFTFQVNSGTFGYTDVPYDDPNTASSTIEKIWYYAFSVTATADLYIKAVARCTQSGVIVLTRVS